MTDKETVLTIAIITYNRPKELKRAIDSCNNINFLYEILVWDNHSNDSNAEINKEVCKQNEKAIKYFYSNVNLGVAGGRNQLWKISRGKFVFFLDDDAVVITDYFFEKLIEFMKNNKKVGAASVDLQEPATDSHHNCKIRHHNGRGYDNTLGFVGGAHVIRKKAYPMDILYPSRLMFGGEELYGSLVLWNEQYEIVEVTDLRVNHMPTAQNRIVNKERDLNFLANSYLVKTMLYPRYIHVLVFVLFLLRLAKNKLSYNDAMRLVKTRGTERLDYKISRKTLYMLIKKFGLFSII